MKTSRLPRVCGYALAAALLCATGPAAAGTLPRPDHVVIVVEENKAYENIIGAVGAPPYINALAQQGALMTQSYGTDGRSQPNYLQLFSGSDQGVSDNTITTQPFTTPNLRSALAAQGLSFTGYSETLPSVGYTGNTYTSVPGQNQYVRKHNPWVNWQGAASNAVLPAETQPFSAFPTDFTQLPTVSIVVPNEQNNMHDGGRATADAWLQQNLNGYVQWAQTHNSLFILTWDEDDGNHGNHITTIFVGPMVIPGQYAQTINHLNVLRTLEDMYGLEYLGNTAAVAHITGAFVSQSVPEPSSLALLGIGGLIPLALRLQTRRRA
ncbi:MAG: alkaline phosphatase family protein [Candidatus Methylumidiphilus sp.]